MYAEQICAKMREEKIPVVYTVHTHAHTVLYIYEGRKKRSFLASLVDIIAINQITGYSGNFLLLFGCAVVVVVCASVQCTIWRVLKPQVLVNIQLPCVYMLPECVCVLFYSSTHMHRTHFHENSNHSKKYSAARASEREPGCGNCLRFTFLFAV